MSLGPAEIIVVLVIALLVFGPTRLPEVGRQVGRTMREFKKFQETIRQDVGSVFHDEPVDATKAAEPPPSLPPKAAPEVEAPATDPSPAEPNEPASTSDASRSEPSVREPSQTEKGDGA